MTALFSPITDTLRGLRSYWTGVRWLLAHPRYFAWLMLPATMGLFAVIGALSLYLHYEGAILAVAYFDRPDAWYALAVWWVGRALLQAAALILSLVAGLLFMNVVASPVYEHVSAAIERIETGVEPPSLGWRQQLRVMLGELKKVAAILAVSILLLFLPGINVLSLVVTAFLVGWDFYDYPLARRGWSFAERWRFVSGEPFAVMGLGLWLVIPFVQFFLMPLAIAGGTLLNLESLRRQSPAPARRLGGER